MIRRIISLLLLLLIFVSNLHAWKMEADKITVDNTNGDTTTHITFRQTFDVTPLVFVLTTDQGGQPSALRVNNVTTTGFDIYSVEPDGVDGPHARMTSVPYIAIEPGIHQFPDGTQITAGTVDTTSFQSKLIAGSSWSNVGLSGFATTPVVLGQIQTRVNERTDQPVPDAVSQPWMTASIANVSSGSFDIALGRAETTSGTLTSNETIAYLAMDSGLSGGNHYFGSNSGDRIEYETIRSNDAIEGWDNSSTGYTINFSKIYSDPIVAVTINTRDGIDGGWLRRREIADDNIKLVVDEDQANDSERAHTTERVGVVLFSEPFDAIFDYTPKAAMIINEILYNEDGGSSGDEFIELYVTAGGEIEGYLLSDQDNKFFRFPSQVVAVGEYVVYHKNSGVDDTTGPVYHFYRNATNYPLLANGGDDVVLLKPDQDVTVLRDNQAFNAMPVDYVSWGSGWDDLPLASMQGVTLTWDNSENSRVDSEGDGESIALTPNATDSHTSTCWEVSGTTVAGEKATNCANYVPTRDTNPDADNADSIGENNTAMPNMSISKVSIVTQDPVNNTTNPKRIPGATVRYCFTVDNTGAGDAGNATISDSLSGSGRDALTYVRSGSVVQDISVACNCSGLNATNGTISGRDVTIVLGGISGTNDTTHSRGCAYIEVTID